MQKFWDKHHNLIYTIGCVLLSFAIPMIITIVLFSKMNFTPFGDKSMTIMMLDMQSQYIAYLRYYRECLLGNVSAIYTETKVFGGDFMSIFCYYLASPFNYFLVFISSSQIPQFLTITALLKISLAGLFMYLCLRFTVNKNSLTLIVPSIGYALISYLFVYIFNFMWFDGVMILPIVILGINKLQEGTHRWIYPLGLAYALMTSWYIGAMICIFAVIYFIYKVAAICTDSKDVYTFATRFAIFSLIGGLLAAPFWLTAFLHLSGTKGSASMPSFEFTNISTFFEGFLEGNYIDISYIEHNTGYFTMFTSVVTLVFFQLFYFNEEHTLRERLVTIGLPVLFFFICNTSRLNALFHGGRNPTWFPGRYSFMLGFIVCYFAGLSLVDIKKTNKFGTLLPLGTLLIVFFITYLTVNDNADHYNMSWPSIVIYITSDVVAAIYMLLPEFKNPYVRYTTKTAFAVILITLTSLSSYRGSYSVLKANLDEGEYEKYELYLEDEAISPAIKAIQNYDSSVYRMETLFDRPGTHNTISNNPLFYGYNGLNHFSSSEKEDCMKMMLKLGFQYNHFFEKYNRGSTVAVNSFLGIKYLIDNDEMHMEQSPVFVDSYPWSKVDIGFSDDSYTYYQNSMALPIAFTMEDTNGLTYVPDGNGTIWYDQFEYQNQLFYQLSDDVKDNDGNKKPIFHNIETSVKSKSDGITIETDENGYKYITGSRYSTITLSFTVPSEAFGSNLYFIEKNNNDNFSYRIDGYINADQSYWYKGIRGFSDNSTHTHTIKVTLKKDLKHEQLRDVVVWEDMDTLEEYINILKAEGMNNVKTIGGLTTYGYEGDITINSADRDLITTLPYESYWKVYIDGKKVKTQQRLWIFLSADLDGISEGTHHIKIVYGDKGLVLSIATASFALATSVGLFVIYKVVNKKKAQA